MTAGYDNRRGKRVVVGSLIFLAAGVAILWGWNTLAADYFGLAAMEFRHALAAEVLLIAASALVGLRGSICRIAE